MPKPPLNHMMLHEDTLADEFDAILNYRTTHAGLVQAGGSYAHNMVLFDGTNDYLTRGAKLTGLVDSQYITFACKFRTGSFAASQRLFTMSASVYYQISTAGVLIRTFNSGSVSTNNALATLSLNTDYTLHMAMVTGSGGTSRVVVYLNGATIEDTAWFTEDTDFNFSTSTNFAIGSTTTGTVKFNGLMGFFYFDASNSAASAVTDATKFYNGGDVDLGADFSTPTGAQPLVGFGGQQTATDWNAGTNLGTGGAFTAASTLTDIYIPSGNRMLVIGDSIAGQHALAFGGGTAPSALTLYGTTTMRVTMTSHGMVVGNTVNGFRATDETLNGRFQVSAIVDANNFEVTLPAAKSGTPAARSGGYGCQKQEVLTDIGSMNWLSALNGACFDIVGVHAEGGSETTYLDDLVAQADAYGLGYDWVTIISGINDAAAGTAGATIAANIIAVADALRAAGKGVIISTVGPWDSGHSSYTAPKYAEVVNANTDLVTYINATPGVFKLDAYEAGSTAGVPDANILSDGLHPSQLGAYTYAKQFTIDNPSVVLPPATTLLSVDANDDVVVTPANRQFWPTPMFTGSGGYGVTYFGTNNTTGTIPANQYVRGYSPNTGGAATTIACSTTTASTGNGNAIVADLGASETNDWLMVSPLDNLAEAVAGEDLRLVMRIRAEATGGGTATQMGRLQAFIQGEFGGTTKYPAAMLYNVNMPAAAAYPPVTETLTLMTPKWRVVTMSGVATLQPFFIAGVKAAATNTYYIENPALRATTT